MCNEVVIRRFAGTFVLLSLALGRTQEKRARAQSKE